MYHRSSINICPLASTSFSIGSKKARRLKGQSGIVELRFLSGTVLGGESLEKVTGSEEG